MSDVSRSTPPGSPLFGFLDITGWIILVAALLYTAGWTYAYDYFANFRVGVLALEIPLEYFFIYGLWVFQQSWLWVVGIGLPVWLMAAWNWRWSQRSRSWWQVVAQLLAVVLLVGLFGGSALLGRIQAEAYFAVQRKTDYADFSRVKVQLKAAPQGLFGTQSKEKGLANGCYRLLLQNRDKIFLFRSFHSIPDAALPVEVVSFDEIASMTILPQSNSCEEE